MAGGICIEPAQTAEDFVAVAALFRLYAEGLPIDPGYQDFVSEMASLPGPYAPPRGALLLAQGGDGSPLGCVGLRPLAPHGRCEMKRLFLAPEARGSGLGRHLAEAVIHEARRIGYREMVLDTLPSMGAAIALYESLGFAKSAPYYGPTPPGTIFMTLVL